MQPLAASMQVVRAPEPGDTDALVFESHPLPKVGDQDVLIRVGAAGLNRLDIFQREGRYPPPRGVTDVLGLEVAGEIVAVGKDVSRWQLGDQGTGSAPATDTVKDFVASQGDALDLRDLLPDGLVAAGSLGDYLSFSYDAAASTTVLSIRTQGTTMSAPDQIIRLEGVDLLGGLSDNDQIIQNLIHNGRLIAD